MAENQVRVCGACGHPNTGDAKFCGRCGATLEALAAPVAAPVAPPPPEPAPARPAPQKTMLGFVPGLGGAPGAPPAAGAPMPIHAPEPADSQLHTEEIRAVTAADVGAAKKAAPQNKTMLGMAIDQAALRASLPGAAPEGPRDPGPGAQPAYQGVPPRSREATAVGVGPQRAPQQAAPAAQPAAPEPAKKKPVGPSNRTMLGMNAPAAGKARPAAAAAPSEGGEGGVDTDSQEISIAGLPSKRRGRGVWIALLIVGFLLFAGTAAGLGYYRLSHRATPVTASVTQGEGGESLRIEVAGAAEGMQLRFRDVERPLVGGRAEFPMAAGDLHVGANALTMELVHADGTREPISVTLTLEYRVRADLTSLSATPPAITVVVEAVPGSTMTVGGQAVTLDANGRGSVAVPTAQLATGDAGWLVHRAEYVVTPPGGAAPANGTLETRVPLAQLELERPLDGAVTDRDRLEFVGRAGPNARVRIGDASVVADASGRFSLEVPLPVAGSDGSTPVAIEATQTERAPRSVTVTVHRVADLTRATDAYAIDRTIDYTRLVENPTALQGRSASFIGQVYNVDRFEGRGVLQMLVRDCRRPDRCPLWVTYSPSVGIAPPAVVRVFGVLSGTQQFRAESGETRSVPKLDAQFVILSR